MNNNYFLFLCVCVISNHYCYVPSRIGCFIPAKTTESKQHAIDKYSVPNKVPLSYNWRISFKQAAIVQRLSITHCRTSVIVLISIAATFLLCYICFSFLDVALNLFVYDRIIYFLFFKDRLKPSQDPLRPLYFCINQKTSTVTSSSCAPTLSILGKVGGQKKTCATKFHLVQKQHCSVGG